MHRVGVVIMRLDEMEELMACFFAVLLGYLAARGLAIVLMFLLGT